MATLGEHLVRALVRRGVDTVFGIPGVHTVELYRGLAGSGIRHVTPRHEQGAGFMADGYARVSGRPGVAFVITGPGLTNILTPMAQARADSVPMLVISGAGARAGLGRGLGYLHELPDQQALAAGVALSSDHVTSAAGLDAALARIDAALAGARPGPAHIEIPIDVMGPAAEAASDAPVEELAPEAPATAAAPDAVAPCPPAAEVARAAGLLAGARAPLILAGGGARRAGPALAALAAALDAPVVQTVNARGLMHGDPLIVPASPSLAAVRDLIHHADVVLAVGTELGATDYDMYGRGGLVLPAGLIRIDLCPAQLARHPAAVAIRADAGAALAALLAALPAGRAEPATSGAARAAHTRKAARAELSEAMRAQLALLEAIRDTLPGAILVGDSTQPVYAGNLYYDHDRPGGWFNAATGFGALGYAIPAAIGAALAAPGARVICIIGDGGAQFTLPELMTAVDEGLPVTFLIWNNRRYGEIASAMAQAGVAVIGCDPTPPDFAAIATACAMPYRRSAMTPAALAAALSALVPKDGPVMIEIDMG